MLHGDTQRYYQHAAEARLGCTFLHGRCTPPQAQIGCACKGLQQKRPASLTIAGPLSVGAGAIPLRSGRLKSSGGGVAPCARGAGPRPLASKSVVERRSRRTAARRQRQQPSRRAHPRCAVPFNSCCTTTISQLEAASQEPPPPGCFVLRFDDGGGGRRRPPSTSPSVRQLLFPPAPQPAPRAD